VRKQIRLACHLSFHHWWQASELECMRCGLPWARAGAVARLAQRIDWHWQLFSSRSFRDSQRMMIGHDGYMPNWFARQVLALTHKGDGGRTWRRV
jgi:hypothetical protein